MTGFYNVKLYIYTCVYCFEVSPSKPSLIWGWRDLTPLHRKQQFIQMWTSQKAEGGTSQNLYYWENQTSIAHICPAKNLSWRVQISFKFQLIQIQLSTNSPFIRTSYSIGHLHLGIHSYNSETLYLVRQLQSELVGLVKLAAFPAPLGFPAEGHNINTWNQGKTLVHQIHKLEVILWDDLAWYLERWSFFPLLTPHPNIRMLRNSPLAPKMNDKKTIR